MVAMSSVRAMDRTCPRRVMDGIVALSTPLQQLPATEHAPQARHDTHIPMVAVQLYDDSCSIIIHSVRRPLGFLSLWKRRGAANSVSLSGAGGDGNRPPAHTEA